MSFWPRFKAFLSREAADVADGLSGLKDRFDEELTRREAELEATPAERLDAIQDEIDEGSDVFSRIEADIDERLADPSIAEARIKEAGVEDTRIDETSMDETSIEDTGVEDRGE